MKCFRNPVRSATRRLNRPLGRPLARPCLRRVIPRRPGPNELSQALTAFRRALRCRRQLAKLAPRFFDSAVADQERRHRAERRQWLALWEPYLNRAYGLDPATRSSDPSDAELPPLPAPAVQRVVDGLLAEVTAWLATGQRALNLYWQRHPHALPSFSQLARLLAVASELGRAACGVACGRPAPPPSDDHAQVWADLQRAYPPPPAPVAPPPTAPPDRAARPPAPPPAPAWPPPDDKRDLTPYALVRGAHGLLCLQRIEPQANE